MVHLKLSDSIEMIDGTMAHAYAIEAAGKLFLVDTGTKGSGKKILGYFKQRGRDPDYILITHYHMDHIGGLELLLQNFSSEVYAPSAEIRIITGVEGLPAGTPGFLKLITKIPKISSTDRIRPVEEMQLEGVTAIDTKGHTPGSTSYMFEGDRALCVGDALHNKKGSLEVNRMFSLDVAKAGESREKILGMKPILVLPGHGDPIRI